MTVFGRTAVERFFTPGAIRELLELLETLAAWRLAWRSRRGFAKIVAGGNVMLLRGRVKNGVIILENGASLADGTSVEVRPTSSTEDRPVPGPVSKEQREALLGLIGIWKTDHPPSDEDVERIIEEERMKKYG